MSVTNNSKNKGVINRTALEVWLDTDDAFIDGANTYCAAGAYAFDDGLPSHTSSLIEFFTLFLSFV